MFYRILADGVVVVHVLFVLFVVCGAWLALAWRWIPWLHVPAAGWGAFVELSGRVCPLTPLENGLRRSAGLEGYDTSFIEHYVLPILYPAELTRELQLVLGVLVLFVNVGAYAYIYRRYLRHSTTNE